MEDRWTRLAELAAHGANVQPGQAVPADERRVEPLEQSGLGRAGEGDSRAAPVGQRQQTLRVPLGHVLEGARIGVLDSGPLQMRIEVDDVDELGAALVARGGHGPGESLLPELR